MIRVKRPEPPQILKDKSKTWNNQAIKAVEKAVDKGEKPKYEWNSDWYGHEEVREALRELFHDKCAYCESRIRHITWDQVEHYRPKKGYGKNPKHLKKPGYYWLGYTWTNLLLSCPRCNQPPGKANQSPVKGKRARRPTDDVSLERPLLLDPTRDDPAQHLACDLTTGMLVERNESARGRATIDICKLNRDELVDERREVITLLGQNRSLVQVCAEFISDPAAKQEALDKLKEQKGRLTADTAQYLAVVRAFFAEEGAS